MHFLISPVYGDGFLIWAMHFDGWNQDQKIETPHQNWRFFRSSEM